MAQLVDRRERTKFVKDIFKSRRGVGINCWFKLLLKDPANQINQLNKQCAVAQLVDRGERTKFIKDIFKSRRGVGIIS